MKSILISFVLAFVSVVLGLSDFVLAQSVAVKLVQGKTHLYKSVRGVNQQNREDNFTFKSNAYISADEPAAVVFGEVSCKHWEKTLAGGSKVKEVKAVLNLTGSLLIDDKHTPHIISGSSFRFASFEECEAIAESLDDTKQGHSYFQLILNPQQMTVFRSP